MDEGHVLWIVSVAETLLLFRTWFGVRPDRWSGFLAALVLIASGFAILRDFHVESRWTA